MDSESDCNESNEAPQMTLRWTGKAQSDLERLHAFLAHASPRAAVQTASTIVAGIAKPPVHPRLGHKLDQFSPMEVRRVLIGEYEVRYALERDVITILRLRHTGDDRQVDWP